MSSGHNVPLYLGGSITDLSVTDGCRVRCGDRRIVPQRTSGSLVNIAHIPKIILASRPASMQNDPGAAAGPFGAGFCAGAIWRSVAAALAATSGASRSHLAWLRCSLLLTLAEIFSSSRHVSKKCQEATWHRIHK
jgi:hypothetical protein